MADPFVGEIRIFASPYPPLNWAFCDGQLMPIDQNGVLYDVIGTVYGGDHRGHFALPDLQGSAPMQPGEGPGLSNYTLGQNGGLPTVVLQQTEMPRHSHSLLASPLPADLPGPSTSSAYARTSSGASYKNTTTGVTKMAQTAIGNAGGGQPHNNMQPYLALSFCIALYGAGPIGG